MVKIMNNEEKFQQITTEMLNTYIAKNHDYGDSFNQTFEEFGLISSIIRLSDKLNRLKKLKDSTAKVDEPIKDTLLDMANYCILTTMELENKTDVTQLDFDGSVIDSTTGKPYNQEYYITLSTLEK